MVLRCPCLDLASLGRLCATILNTLLIVRERAVAKVSAGRVDVDTQAFKSLDDLEHRMLPL